MAPQPPRVSICVPVRNGQKYLAECIESILQQTFTDFELILCDNASTDSTPAICQRFAERDARIRCIHHDHNLGPAENFNSGLELARGEFFRWQAHDDLIARDYLEKCVAELDADPSLVAVYPQAQVIDDRGNAMEDYDFAIEIDSPSFFHRFRQAVLARQRAHRNFEVFGLIRTGALRSIPQQGPYAHADRVLTCRLTLLGRLKQIHEHLFLARWHAAQSMQHTPTGCAASVAHRLLGPGVLPPPEWWNPALKNRVTFPEWKLLREHARSIRLAGASVRDRAAAALVVSEWLLRNWPKLGRDIVFAADALAMRVVERFRSRPRPAVQPAHRAVN